MSNLNLKRKGLRSNEQKLKFLIENSDLKLYKYDKGDFLVLDIDAKKFQDCYEKYGGMQIFGTPSQWGDVFQNK